MILGLQIVAQTALSQEVPKDKQLCSQINRGYNNQSYAGCRSDYEAAFEYTVRFLPRLQTWVAQIAAAVAFTYEKVKVPVI